MAFGMKFGGAVGKFLLSFFRIALSGALCWWIASLVRKSVDSEGKSALLPDGKPVVPTGVLVGLTLITAGAFGNIIDSLFYGVIFDYAPLMFGRVVDMFYFPIIDTFWPSWVPFVGGDRLLFFAPVFNFADSCVTVGAFYLIFSRTVSSPVRRRNRMRKMILPVADSRGTLSLSSAERYVSDD